MNMIILFINLLSLILFFNFTLFYLDDFKLSTYIHIKFLQILSPLILMFLFILIYYNILIDTDLITVLGIDKVENPTINIQTNIQLDKEAAQDIKTSINTLGRNIGLAGTVGAVTGGVAKVISKSSLPPLQKAGMVIAGGVAGAGIHMGASAFNTILNKVSPGTSTDSSKNTLGTTTVSDSADTILLNGQTKSLLGNQLTGGSGTSALNDLILGIDMINYACLSLVIILFSIILFKFILNFHIQFNLSKWLGNSLNTFLNHYLNKLIQLNQQTSTVYIFIILILLIVSLSFNCYFTTGLYNNLDKFIEYHITSKGT